MAKTKTELEAQIKELKAEVRELRSEVKVTSTTVEGLKDDAYALNKVGKDYQLVKILYNVETGESTIDSVENIGSSLSMASHKIKKVVIDRLIKIKDPRKAGK